MSSASVAVQCTFDLEFASQVRGLGGLTTRVCGSGGLTSRVRGLGGLTSRVCGSGGLTLRPFFPSIFILNIHSLPITSLCSHSTHSHTLHTPRTHTPSTQGELNKVAVKEMIQRFQARPGDTGSAPVKSKTLSSAAGDLLSLAT